MKRLGIFAHYDAQGEVKGYVLEHLKALRRHCSELIFVSTSDLSGVGRVRASEYCGTVLTRPNTGFDFLSWRSALETVELGKWDEIVLTNSSVFGPLQGRLDTAFERMRENPADFWGMTGSHDIAWHLQSYFLVFRKRALASEAFSRFWQSVLPYRDKKQVIRSYEVGLTTFLLEAGLTADAYVRVKALPESDGDEFRGNATCLIPATLLDKGMPYVKVELLRDNPCRIDIEPVRRRLRRAGYAEELIEFDRPVARNVARGSAARNVVITGASSGIGAALAHRYAREGGMLGLVGRDRSRLETVAEQCRVNGHEVRTAAIDVRDRSALAAWLEEFDDEAPVDIVIANAGISAGTTPDWQFEDAEESYTLMQTNVLGVLNTVQPLIPRMLARGRGQIAIMGSIAALIPLPDASAYSASKAALLSYGLALRGHLYKAGISVTVICPGYVTSPMSVRIRGWKPLEMSVQAAADHIVRRLRRDPDVIIFPWLLALAARAGMLLPDRLRRLAMAPFRFYIARRP